MSYRPSDQASTSGSTCTGWIHRQGCISRAGKPLFTRNIGSSTRHKDTRQDHTELQLNRNGPLGIEIGSPEAAIPQQVVLLTASGPNKRFLSWVYSELNEDSTSSFERTCGEHWNNRNSINSSLILVLVTSQGSAPVNLLSASNQRPLRHAASNSINITN
ncbi:uncharacterized protein YALI1_C32558g [Yarrowia lipolytica]|uniref:Uncharacterized protein n=1 Tax=Yarrowia lipolytica TaxID=4952 RepID=A0A1D8NCG0_YARLL|nr:hypothetical protein YALI1_C32558g [Yarrowia lipolytica]